MRAVIQRVTDADVTVDNKITGSIGKGFVVLLGVEDGDTTADADYMVEKITGLRVFEDEDVKSLDTMLSKSVRQGVDKFGFNMKDAYFSTAFLVVFLAAGFFAAGFFAFFSSATGSS